MDSKLKRQVTVLVVVGALLILSVALLANATTIKNKLGKTSSSTPEPQVIVDEVQAIKNVDGFTMVGHGLDNWKADETFFDSSNDSLTMKIMEEMSTLSVKAVSVEKDLRIRILDYNGNLKTDIPFEVSLKSHNGKTELFMVDEDKDGIIYASDLKPGKYELLMSEVEEWIVPVAPIEVEVKDFAEYLMIEDVDILMKSEATVASSADNAMTLSAINDADKKISSKFGEDETLVYGIDISSENGEIDWNQVYQSGIRFVMLRAGYRGAFSGEIYTDDSFSEYAKEANRAGLDVGAYFYTQAINEREAVEEASAMILLASQSHITYPLCIRVDMAGGMGRADEIDSNTRTEVVNAFCQTIKNSGYDPCFYATKNWLSTNLNTSKLDKNRIWLAEYRKVPTYEGFYDMWEYSCNGKVPGIDGDVNLNISFMNR